MEDEIKKIKKSTKKLEKKLQKYCKDNSIPLDKRWKLFEKSNLGNQSCRTNFGLEDHGDEFLYDGPIYMNKYETRSVFDILKSLIQGNKEGEYDFSIEDEVIFKNYCLNNFYSRMVFDW